MGFTIMCRCGLVTLLLALCQPAHARDWIYTVVDGDNLWNLSAQHLKHAGYWRRLQQLNQIQNPKRLRSGSKLRVPMAWLAIHPAVAKVEAIRGRAEAFADGGEVSVPLSKGAEITLGTRITTSAEASVAVRFADGSSITIHEHSVVDFDHLSAYGDQAMVDTRLRLQQGRVDTRANKATGPGSRFEIETPAAISAVRGTRFRAAHSTKRDTSTVEVLDGGVGVTGAGTTRRVGAAFGVAARPERPPNPPKPLLPAPRFDTIPQLIEQRNWPVTWQAIEGATRYRAIVGDSVDFTLVRWVRLAPSARIALPELPDGSYFLQVRAIDADGIEGIDAVAPIRLDTHPQPPVPTAPQEAAVLRGGMPELRWTASTEAANYRLQLSGDAGFAAPLIDRDDLADTKLQPDDSDTPGEFFWRIASIDASGHQGPFGPIRRFDLKPIPEEIQPELGEHEDALVASWPAGQGGQSFHVQVAEDAGFQTLLVDTQLDESRLALQPTPGQVRYLRIRVIEPDGYLGPWGNTQRLDPPVDNSWWMVVVPGLLLLLL